MKALCVVKPDPVFNDPLFFGPVDDFVQANGLLFQGPSEALDEDVFPIDASRID